MNGAWRLIVDGAGTGARNMAVDEALLQCGPEGAFPPTLRLYWWKPWSLSLGANQDAAGLDPSALEVDGLGLVRRPTGGRAILHAEEITYSVTAPAPAGGTLAAYRWIAEALREGLRNLGVPVDLERMQRPGARGLETRHPCFGAAGRYELVAEGRKVVGSAQRRRRGWLMQHGSILLGSAPLRLPRYLGSPDPGREEQVLRAGTVDCSALLGRPLTPEQVVEPFTAGFAAQMGILLEQGVLAEAERERAGELERSQFGTSAWTMRGLRPEPSPASARAVG